MTTDQDLIADGVQAIDGEFLEWFVNNSSCEEVEVDRDEREVGNHLGGAVTQYGDYKIIIPQEEPIQELLPDFKITKNIFDFVTDLSDTNKEEPKQETTGKEFYESADKVITVERQETLPEFTLSKNIFDKISDLSNQETLEEYDIKDNQIMLLKEDLECVHMYLDDLELPRIDNKGEAYSIVGRIKRLEERMYSEEEVKRILMKTGNYTKISLDAWFEQFKKK
jgi:hypothetical protein